MKELHENLGLLGETQQSIQCLGMNANGSPKHARWCYISSPSTPASPDPNTTASAQTASNQATAGYQAGLNNVNQNTPLGDLSYSYGTQDINGQTVPQTNSNITLNPLVQNALTSSLQTSGAESNLANQYEQQVQNTMSTPYNLNSVGPAPTPDAAYQKSIMDNENALEQPYIDRSNEQLQASLANQGITQGSEAYNNAQMDQNNSLNNLQQQNIQNATQQEQSQYAMQQQAYEQQLQNYSQNYTMPLNQLSALQSGSQVAQPSFSSPSQTSVNPTNVAGIVNSAYQNSLNASNAGTASNNSLMGGLFGLGGSLGAAALLHSDRRLKTNIRRIGQTPGGIPVYKYVYKSGGAEQIGVMADEVKKVIPEAVININGFYAVDYGMIK